MLSSCFFNFWISNCNFCFLFSLSCRCFHSCFLSFLNPGLSWFNEVLESFLFVKFSFENLGTEMFHLNSSFVKQLIFIFSFHYNHSDLMFLLISRRSWSNHLLNAFNLHIHLEFSNFKQLLFRQYFLFSFFFRCNCHFLYLSYKILNNCSLLLVLHISHHSFLKHLLGNSEFLEYLHDHLLVELLFHAFLL